MKINLHINNGGVTFEIKDTEHGPAIYINATHFGHKTNSMEIYTDKEALKEIGDMFIKASEQPYNPSYCNKAIPFERMYAERTQDNKAMAKDNMS